MDQLNDEDLLWTANDECNSIAVIVKHLHGNMMSRWTDFLSTDGEKEWRNRDDEFVADLTNRESILRLWQEGWKCLLKALNSISDNDLDNHVLIRNKEHTILEAINRQLAHYAYHVGQIIYIGKQMKGANWQSLSIPPGGSESFNQKSFIIGKRKEHFTDEWLDLPGRQKK